MKKFLSVVLAVLVLIGVFAVGASAISLEGFTNVGEAVVAQETDDDIAKKIKAIMYEADGEFVMRFLASPAVFACSEYFRYSNIKNALKSGKTEQALDEALKEIDADLYEASAEYQAFRAFTKDEAALRAAYEAGTLKDELTVFYNALYDQGISCYEPLANEFFLPEALAAAAEFSKFYSLAYVFMLAELTQEKYAEIDAKYGTIWNKWVKAEILPALNEGNFEEAIRLIKNAVKELEKLLADYGIITISNPEPEPEPSFFAKLWNFILKWLFFGWLWMK